MGKHHHLLGKVLLLLGAMLAVFALSTTDTSAKSKKVINTITSGLNEDMQGNSDYGNTTFAWDKKTKSFIATLDKDSIIYSQMNDGQVTNWDALVDGLKSESKVLKKNGYSKYSAFQIINPEATDRSLLQIYKGKVKYNVRDDLQ